MGLPRSRTAWLANWFTHQNSICTHDASRFCKRGITSLRKILHRTDAYKPYNGWYDENTPKRLFYGSSDSVNGWWYDGLLEKFPDAKFALVERNIDEVSDSCVRLFNDPCLKELKALQAMHETIKKEPNVKGVAYERLNHAAILQDLQKWLTPGVPFDYARYEMLNGLDIIINPRKYAHGL